MSVNYIETDGKKVLYKHEHAACYSSIFSYSCNKNTTEILLYEPTLVYNGDKLIAWIKMMNQNKFWIKYLGKNSEEAAKYNIAEHYHVFQIDVTKQLKKNHLCSTLTLARYLFETGCGHEKFVNAYFDIREALPKISTFRALLMAHLYHSGGGHSCSYPNRRNRFITLKQLFDKFDKGPTVYEQIHSNIFECWNQGDLVNVDPGKDYKTIYNKLNGKKIMTKVFVVGNAKNYANWLPDIKLVNKLEDSDVVLFTGGEDVDPSLYGEPANPRTGSNIVRDRIEKEMYELATKLKKKKLGICRGSQFLCVMNGGKLVQHQQNPLGLHPIKTTQWGEINITSTHHQAALPYPSIPFYRYKILGWTTGISKIHQDGNEKEIDLKDGKECEIVHYIVGNSLGIQGHPEFAEYQRDPANQKSLEVLKTIFTKFVKDTL